MGRDTGRANFPSSSRRVANILAESTTLNECPLGRALRHGSVQARDLLFYRGAGVPPRADRQQDAQARVPEPPLIGHVRGKPRRWVVERTNSWHNSFRGLRTRWERKVERYGALVELACAIITKPSRERPTGHDGSLLAPWSEFWGPLQSVAFLLLLADRCTLTRHNGRRENCSSGYALRKAVAIAPDARGSEAWHDRQAGSPDQRTRWRPRNWWRR